MKKTACVLISVFILISVFTPCLSIAKHKIEIKDVYNFCNEVTQMNEKYNSAPAGIKFNENGDKNYGYTENRLIIQTDKMPQSTLAIDVLYGLDYAVLQYRNKSDMLQDYEKFSESGYTVQKDMVFYSADTDTAYEEGKLSISASSSSSYGWGPDKSGALYAKSIIENSGKNYDDIVVGIMDTGVDYTHEVFDGRFIENNMNFSTSGDPEDPMDDQGHGTSVASIVVMCTPDNVKIKPYKILNEDGSTTLTEIVAACEYIMAEKEKPDIINMSFGGYKTGEDREIQDNCIRRLVESGITVCAAAGNEFLPSQYATPAGINEVITVSAHDSANEFCDFSDYGEAVDICAPGENIYSADMGGGYSHTDKTGTSVACPFVSAACTYVLMQNPDAQPEEIKEKIKSSAIDMGEDDSYYYGAGVLSISNLFDDDFYSAPQPSVSGGLYHEAQNIEFDVPSGTKLIYTTDRSVPSATNGTEYTGAITIDCDTQLNFALMSDDAYLSPITSQHYAIQYYADSSDFTIIAGVITSYNSDKTNIIVPDKINGRTPTSILRSVFKNSNLTSIVLPDTITTLGTSCFEGSTKLRHITANGVTLFSGDNVFSGCTELREEVMPNLKTVTASAFKDCSKLRAIDFGENITEFKNSLFSGSGLMYADFPNAVITNTSVESVFEDCPLYSCNIPNVTILCPNFFYRCYCLSELTIGQVTRICSKALGNCWFLNELDTSKLETIDNDALYGCYLDTLYAPKCTSLPGRFGQYCYVRVIDMPNATGTLGTQIFNCSTVEELYFDSVTAVASSSAFTNVIELNIVYLPNATSFYGPYTNVSLIDEVLTGDYWKAKPPLEMIWIPKAETMSAVKLTDTKLLFAPGISALNVDVQNENAQTCIVLSDKVTEGNLTVDADGQMPVIIAPDNSYAGRNSLDEGCGYTFVSADDCIYDDCDADGNLLYKAGKNDFSVPLDFVVPCWDADAINKTRNESYYEFLLDFTNDHFINAKDYSVLTRNVNGI